MKKLTLLSVLVLVGYASDTPPMDASVETDAGAQPDAGDDDAGMDAGSLEDGGSFDAGSLEDGGSFDAGFLEDGGSVDAGSLEDGGAFDAGCSCSLPNATARCEDTGCVIQTCDDGFGDCNGDPADGCEAALDTLSDCGACGTTCSVADGTAACSGGICAVASCDDGFGDCNGDPADGCETVFTAWTAWTTPTTVGAGTFTNPTAVFASDDIYATALNGPGCYCPRAHVSWDGGATVSAYSALGILPSSGAEVTSVASGPAGAEALWGHAWTLSEVQNDFVVRLRAPSSLSGAQQNWGGFDFSSIPSGSEVLAIELRVEVRHGTSGADATLDFDRLEARVRYRAAASCF